MLRRLSLRVRIFLFFALLAFGGAALIIAGLVIGYTRLGEGGALSAFIIAGAIAIFALFGLTTWVWVLFDEHVARPVERLAADLRARAHADVDQRIDHAIGHYLGDLAPAADAVAANLTETRNAMAMAVGRETARLNAEKTRLEALLADIPDGVIFCTAQHMIALYNGRCREILPNVEALGLGRPVAGLLRMGPIHQAYGRLIQQAGPDGADILVTTRQGAQLLEARLRLVQIAGQDSAAPGYVLILRDVTAELKVAAERAHLLKRLLDGVQTCLPNLPESPAKTMLSALVQNTAARKSATDTAWWPMEALGAADLGAALKARLERKGLVLTPDLDMTDLRCDGFAITRMLERLALAWSQDGAEELRLTFASIGPQQAVLSLEAMGQAPDPTRLAQWLDTPLAPGLSGFSGHDVLLSHGTTLGIEPAGPGRHALRLSLARATLRPSGPSRMVMYDFDLLHAALPDALAKVPLTSLSYVIFDTETTGLNPQSDEICQIAALRLVNGKVVAGERFDMLVNPGRRIPAAATAVHRITDAMVADAPDVATALARFHAFAKDAVLVAHNAPFDMSFLRRREPEIGVRFDQPILDTVLCSAILYGQSAEHTLDALCARLHITIPEDARHTAIGDAIATAEAFRKMIPMLHAAELPNLEALIKAFDRHSRLIEHLN
ncbi:DNA polymerase III subunit epsilon [Rhodobacterales bacterium LSUCC0031]|nr:DNA polymerase III subunit epsilon [Rhodobacterales bacterium LSUCC0031]